MHLTGETAQQICRTGWTKRGEDASIDAFRFAGELIDMNEAFQDELLNDKSASPGTVRSRARIWVVTIIVLSGLAGFYGLVQYNSLQRSDEIIEAQWSFALNQYRHRADLVPNLVNVVKAYASNESDLFTTIAHERSQLAESSRASISNRDLKQLDAFQREQNQLSAHLGQLLAVSERYPELRSSELYRDLMAQLEGCENRIAYARQRYIIAITEYNMMVRSFPTSMIAARAGNTMRPRFTDENVSSIARPPVVDLK